MQAKRLKEGTGYDLGLGRRLRAPLGGAGTGRCKAPSSSKLLREWTSFLETLAEMASLPCGSVPFVATELALLVRPVPERAAPAPRISEQLL